METIERPDRENSVVYAIKDERTGLRAFIAVHKNHRDCNFFGATRLARYASEDEAQEDALRLAKLMSYKSVMAGLPYGGAKGVIMLDEEVMSKVSRRELLECYAGYVNELKGKLITGADVGLSREDIRVMSKVSPYFVGLTSDPVKWTVVGLFYAMQVTLDEVFQKEACVEKRSFAIQGVGKIGTGLLEFLYEKGARIYFTDIDRRRVEFIKDYFPDAEHMEPDKIFDCDVDVFCPCALGGSLNPETVERLKCKAIVGGANNQLSSPEVGELLHKKGILYAPDYVINCGGLISVADEYENRHSRGHGLRNQIERVRVRLRGIYERSKTENKPTSLIADAMAEEETNKK